MSSFHGVFAIGGLCVVEMLSSKLGSEGQIGCPESRVAFAGGYGGPGSPSINLGQTTAADLPIYGGQEPGSATWSMGRHDCHKRAIGAFTGAALWDWATRGDLKERGWPLNRHPYHSR